MANILISSCEPERMAWLVAILIHKGHAVEIIYEDDYANSGFEFAYNPHATSVITKKINEGIANQQPSTQSEDSNQFGIIVIDTVLEVEGSFAVRHLLQNHPATKIILHSAISWEEFNLKHNDNLYYISKLKSKRLQDLIEDIALPPRLMLVQKSDLYDLMMTNEIGKNLIHNETLSFSDMKRILKKQGDNIVVYGDDVTTTDSAIAPCFQLFDLSTDSITLTKATISREKYIVVPNGFIEDSDHIYGMYEITWEN